MYKLKLIKWLFFSVIVILNLNSVEAKEFKAKLSWYNLTNLSFRVNGIVASIKVKPGDIVKTGKKLIVLDQREYVDNNLLTKTQRKLHKSELDEAKRELDRALELYDRTVLSEHELQVVKNDFILSKTNFLSADIKWQQAKRNLEFSQILAPFNAIILFVAVNEHETVISSFESKPAIKISDSSKISAQFKLTVDDFKKIKNNSKVEVLIDGISYEGTLILKSLIAEQELYQAAAVISVSDNIIGNKLRSGMNAVVKIIK